VVLGIALLAAGLCGSISHDAQAKPPGYTFKPIAKIGDQVPSKADGIFVNDFEPGGLNSQGDMAFGADVSTGGEGVFLKPHNGQIIELGRTGGPAPGGGTFGGSFLGPMGQNDQGDAVFNFLLEPFDPTKPFGFNAGTYRYSHSTHLVTPVVIPLVTPAPGGGTFQGVGFQPAINNRGDEVFPGYVNTDQGIFEGLGLGIFRADSKGRITKVVVPGDPAPPTLTTPKGGTFDNADEPWINDGGDVAFKAQITGEEIGADGIYVKEGGTGNIYTIAHPGDPAPGGGRFRAAAHEMMNNRGDIAFFGDLTPHPDFNQTVGAFLYSGGKLIAVARPGDPMPGGGNLVNTSLNGANYRVNNRGDVIFTGEVDTDVDSDGQNDTGLFQWSHGELSLVAKTGTIIPAVGTMVFAIAATVITTPPTGVPSSPGAAINDAGQVLFCATMINGDVVLLLATPRP